MQPRRLPLLVLPWRLWPFSQAVPGPPRARATRGRWAPPPHSPHSPCNACAVCAHVRWSRLTLAVAVTVACPCLPCSAQLYMVMKASKEHTSGGEGVVVIKNEPFDNTDGHMGFSTISQVEVPRKAGQYTLKEYHLASKVPGIVRAMLPSNMLILVEEAWNCYPYCKTVLTNGYLDKEKFKIDIESMHLPDAGTTENALALGAAELKDRKVEKLDVRTAYVGCEPKDYKVQYDSSVYKSKVTGRGPLAAGWETSTAPVMCCYKLVRAHFKYFGAQTKVEGIILKSQRELFARSLSSAFCMIDEWHALSIADIRRLEASAAEELNAAVMAASPTPGPAVKELAASEHAHGHDHGHDHGHGHGHGVAGAGAGSAAAAKAGDGSSAGGDSAAAPVAAAGAGHGAMEPAAAAPPLSPTLAGEPALAP